MGKLMALTAPAAAPAIARNGRRGEADRAVASEAPEDLSDSVPAWPRSRPESPPCFLALADDLGHIFQLDDGEHGSVLGHHRVAIFAVDESATRSAKRAPQARLRKQPGFETCQVD